MKKIKEFFNEEITKLNYKDYIILGLIILIYSFISFYRLGSATNPNTFVDFQKGSSIIIKLQKEESIIRLKAFNGEKNAHYKVFVSKENKIFDYVTEIKGEGSFAWNEERLLTRGKYLKLVFVDDSTLGELAFYNNYKEIININSISNNTQKINTLTDEKSTIPEQISYYNSTYFDEIYFARTAYEYSKGLPTYEWTHPPLGKLIQAIPIYITKKMTPFNYRLMGNLSGIFMLIIMYLFGKELFHKRKYALLATILMALDTFHFTQTRIGTVDSHLVLFIISSLFFMYKFTKNSKVTDLLLSGLFFALSISVKWTGFYGGFALAMLYFSYIIKNKQFNLKRIGQGITFFVIIPIIIYSSLYLLFPNNNLNYTDNPKAILEQQKEMYKYHSNLESTHFFSSKWYTWPIVYKPIWYHNQTVDANTRETITAIGNIAIWWLGIISVIYMILKAFIKKDRRSIFLLTIIFSLWLPYILIGRVMFLYHYFPVLPFIILSIVLMFKDIVEKYKSNLFIYIYLLIVILFFTLYYPVISGKAISNNHIEKLKLFSSWYF